MSECENYVDDFQDIFINGHHDTEDTSYCELTGERCAKDDYFSICPKEDEE